MYNNTFIEFTNDITCVNYEEYGLRTLDGCTKEASLKGRISTVDLPVLTSLYQLLFKLKLDFSFLFQTTNLN